MFSASFQIPMNIHTLIVQEIYPKYAYNRYAYKKN